MISPEAGDCPAELPPDEVRQGVRGDGPQVWLPSLVGHGGQTIQPERNKLEYCQTSQWSYHLLGAVRQDVRHVFLQLHQTLSVLILTSQHGASDGTRLSQRD